LVYCDAWICGDSPLAGRRFMDLCRRVEHPRKPLVHRHVHSLNLSADPIAAHQRVINFLRQPF
jgi:hypothetical protein